MPVDRWVAREMASELVATNPPAAAMITGLVEENEELRRELRRAEEVLNERDNKRRG